MTSRASSASPQSFSLFSILVWALSQHRIWLLRVHVPKGQAPECKCLSSLRLHHFAKISLANTSRMANPRDNVGQGYAGVQIPKAWITGDHQYKRTSHSLFWLSMIHVCPTFKIYLPLSQHPCNNIPFQHQVQAWCPASCHINQFQV